MIFDHRTYNIKPNRLGKILETYERLALPLQRKYLGEPYGCISDP
jgi:NIPSNAP protein